MPLPLAEACLRNQAPICDCLENILTRPARVLELGSGTGQHAVYIAEHLPHLIWQPTELAERRGEVEAWRKDKQLDNVLETLVLDVSEQDWKVDESYDAVFTANTVHFISWGRVEALLKGTSHKLEKGGDFLVYGPFNVENEYTSDGNRNLDAWLKSRDASSGIKDRDAFLKLAQQYHLSHIETYTMPANNIILHLKKV